MFRPVVNCATTYKELYKSMNTHFENILSEFSTSSLFRCGWALSLLAISVCFSNIGLAHDDDSLCSLPKSPIETVSPSKVDDPFALADTISIDNQSIVVDGKTISYNVRAGALSVKGKDEKCAADISFIAYFSNEPTPKSGHVRPLAFCFNGGPGSSSVWLHMGFLGPKTVDLKDFSHPPLPVGYKDNPQSLLSVCDLVFIDPVSTGFSTASGKENATKFHGVEEDLFSIADFIRLFLTKFDRWESPKLLIGESYGTMRAVGITRLLQDRYFIDINGLILISLVLDLQSIDNSYSLDIPHVTSLPSLAAIANYHKQLNGPLTQCPVPQLTEMVKTFAVEEYAPALLLGSKISSERKERIAKRLAEFTSLPESTITAQNLRISLDSFFREFLKSKNLMIGRFDGRTTAFRVPEEYPVCQNLMGYPDPSFYAIAGTFASAFQEYLARDLKWLRGDPYVVISDNVHPWNWTVRSQPTAGCGYLSFIQDFRVAMSNNPALKVFVAAGYYDLSTPYFSQEYSLSHLMLPPELQKGITFKGYEAGHMMYLDEGSRVALFNDLKNFVTDVNTQ